MLYDLKWHNPDLADIRDWLSLQPADGTYDWIDTDNCPCAQYAKAHGVICDWRDGWSTLNRLAQMKPRTYGALLERVKKQMSN
jgi:hypothetical protein